MLLRQQDSTILKTVSFTPPVALTMPVGQIFYVIFTNTLIIWIQRSPKIPSLLSQDPVSPKISSQLIITF